MNAQEHIEYLEGQLAAVNRYLGFLFSLIKVSLPAEPWKTTLESFKSVQAYDTIKAQSGYTTGSHPSTSLLVVGRSPATLARRRGPLS